MNIISQRTNNWPGLRGHLPAHSGMMLTAILISLVVTTRAAADDPTFDLSDVRAKGEISINPTYFDHVAYTLHALKNPVTRPTILELFSTQRQSGSTLSLDAKSMAKVPYFDFNPYVPKGKWGIFTFSVTIHASEDAPLIILTDGRIYQRLVCNGETLPLYYSDQWIEKYGVAQRVNLRKGINQIGVSVAGYKGRCSFAISLATVEKGESIARANWIATALERYIYTPGETVLINKWSFAGPIAAWSVCNPGSETFDAALPVHSVTKSGVYTVALRTKTGELIHEPIAVVDEQTIQSKIAAISKCIAQGRRSAQAKSDFEIFTERLAFLLDPSKRRPERFIGDRDLVEMLKELDVIFADVREDPNCDWVNSPGRHFGTYVSQLQASPTPYMLYLPKDYVRSKPCSLVVIMPAASPTRPKFSESYSIDYRGLVQSFLQAADREKMVVLWPYAENEHHTRRMEQRVDECITAVASRFSVDTKRICAIGSCGGARDSLMFAARERPDLLAVAAHEVIFVADSDEKPENPHSIGTSTPLRVLDALKDIPIFLSHGELDRHVPVRNTKVLYSRLLAAGAKPTLDVITGADEAYCPAKNDVWIDEAFAFFGAQRTSLGETNSLSARSDGKPLPNSPN